MRRDEDDIGDQGFEWRAGIADAVSVCEPVQGVDAERCSREVESMV